MMSKTSLTLILLGLETKEAAKEEFLTSKYSVCRDMLWVSEAVQNDPKYLITMFTRTSSGHHLTASALINVTKLLTVHPEGSKI